MTLEEKLARHDYRMLESVDRIQRYKVHGWHYIDDYNVVFRGGPSTYYLLTFYNRCLNLRSANAVAFSTTVGNVTRFDDVYVRDQSGFPAERCRIDAMHKLEKIG